MPPSAVLCVHLYSLLLGLWQRVLLVASYLVVGSLLEGGFPNRVWSQLQRRYMSSKFLREVFLALLGSASLLGIVELLPYF